MQHGRGGRRTDRPRAAPPPALACRAQSGQESRYRPMPCQRVDRAVWRLRHDTPRHVTSRPLAPSEGSGLTRIKNGRYPAMEEMRRAQTRPPISPIWGNLVVIFASDTAGPYATCGRRLSNSVWTSPSGSSVARNWPRRCWTGRLELPGEPGGPPPPPPAGSVGGHGRTRWPERRASTYLYIGAMQLDSQEQPRLFMGM